MFGPVASPRSTTQPVQVLCAVGVQVAAAVHTPGVHFPVVQVAPLLVHCVFVVYLEFEQDPAAVQVLWVVWLEIEHVPAAVQVAGVVLPEIEHVPPWPMHALRVL